MSTKIEQAQESFRHVEAGLKEIQREERAQYAEVERLGGTVKALDAKIERLEKSRPRLEPGEAWLKLDDDIAAARKERDELKGALVDARAKWTALDRRLKRQREIVDQERGRIARVKLDAAKAAREVAVLSAEVGPYAPIDAALPDILDILRQIADDLPKDDEIRHTILRAHKELQAALVEVRHETNRLKNAQAELAGYGVTA